MFCQKPCSRGIVWSCGSLLEYRSGFLPRAAGRAWCQISLARSSAALQGPGQPSCSSHKPFHVPQPQAKSGASLLLQHQRMCLPNSWDMMTVASLPRVKKERSRSLCVMSFIDFHLKLSLSVMFVFLSLSSCPYSGLCIFNYYFLILTFSRSNRPQVFMPHVFLCYVFFLSLSFSIVYHAFFFCPICDLGCGCIGSMRELVDIPELEVMQQVCGGRHFHWLLCCSYCSKRKWHNMLKLHLNTVHNSNGQILFSRCFYLKLN